MKKRDLKPEKKKQIIRDYNQSSSYYDARYKNIQFEKYSLIFSKISLNNRVILDAGCGTGLLFEFFHHDTSNCGLSSAYLYVGIDISSEMLAIFNEKIKNKYPLSEHKVGLILGDLEHLPLREDVFKTVYSLTSLQNLPSKHKGMLEMIRVAKLGAEFKMSILRKKIDPKEIATFVESYFITLSTIEKSNLEDFIICGVLKRKETNHFERLLKSR